MAIKPGTLNMTILRRSDHSVNFELKDSNSAAVNLSGSQLNSQVWDSARTAKAADVSISITNASGGTFSWTLTDVQTATFTSKEYKYDILLTNSSGLKEYWLKGTITMEEGFTE